MAKLTFKLNGGNEEIDFDLSQGIVSVGRTPQNDISIDDSSLSAVHAELRKVSAEGIYELTDLKSGISTMVNGVEVSQTVLKSGDVIMFGEVEAVFESGAMEEGMDGDSGGIARRAVLPPPRKSGERPKSLIEEGASAEESSVTTTATATATTTATVSVPVPVPAPAAAPRPIPAPIPLPMPEPISAPAAALTASVTSKAPVAVPTEAPAIAKSRPSLLSKRPFFGRPARQTTREPLDLPEQPQQLPAHLAETRTRVESPPSDTTHDLEDIARVASDAKRKELAELERTLQQRRTELKDFESRRVECEKLETKVAERSSALQQLETKVADLKTTSDKHAKTNAQLEALAVEREKMEQANLQLKKKQVTLAQVAEESAKKNKASNKELEAVQSELETKRKQLLDTEQRIGALEQTGGAGSGAGRHSFNKTKGSPGEG